MNVHTVYMRKEPLSSHVAISTQLIGSVGEQSYVEHLVKSLSQIVDFAHLGVLAGSSTTPPTLLETASKLFPDRARETAEIYLGGHFYKVDPTEQIRAANLDSCDRLFIHRQTDIDIVDADYRRRCYEDSGIIDRLSIFQHFKPDIWISVNIYRDRSQGYFNDDGFTELNLIAPILTSTANVHRRLVMPRLVGSVRSGSTPQQQRALTSALPPLSNREKEVCNRILLGFTAKEIARQLGIAPTTVVEHRKNAYTKLAIRDHKQLFAKFHN